MRRWLILALLVLLAVSADAFYPSIECARPGDPTCDTLRVEGGTSTRVTTPPAAAFSATGGGYAAEVEDCQRLSPAEAVADTTASNGNYVQVPLGSETFRGHIACRGNFTNATYYAAVVARVPSAANNVIRLSTSSHPSVPDNTLAGVLYSNQAATSFTLMPIGRYGSLASFLNKNNTTSQQTFALNGDAAIHILVDPDVHLDRICLHTSAATVLDATGPCGTQTAVNYTIREMGATTPPTIDGTEDSLWGQANAVTFGGTNSGITATPTLRLIWDEGSPDRLYGLYQVTLANMSASTTAEDDNAITGDTGVELYWRHDLTRTRDSSAYKVVVNGASTPARLDGNYPSNTLSTTYDFANWSAARTYSANVLTIEFAFDLPAVSGGTRGVCDFAAKEDTTTTTATYQNAFSLGSIFDIATWGVCEFSATTIAPPADTTIPTISTTAESGITQTAATVTTTGSDNASTAIQSTVRYGTASGGPYTSTSSTVTTSGTCTSSCTSNNALSGLTAGITYYYVVDWRDQANNLRTSTQDSFTTTAAGTTRYISPSGTNSGGCTDSGSPCRTFAFVIPLLNAGETLSLANGTYTTATNGNLTINCGTSGTARNGTSSQRITVQAANQRQAFLQNDGVRTAVKMTSCNYWTIDGLRVESQDNSGDLEAGTLIYLTNSANNIIRNNLLRNVNRYAGGGGVLLYQSGSRNNLVEGNELYNFDRNGIYSLSASFNTFRRNYCRVGDSRGGDPSPGGGPNECYVLYYSSDSIMENNIMESAFGFSSSAGFGTSGQRNRFLGNIAYGAANQLLIGEHPQEGMACRDNVVENFVAVSQSPTVNGILLRSALNTTIDHVSIFGGTGNGLFADNIYDPRNGTCSPYSPCDTQQSPGVTVTNMLVSGTTGGYYVDHASQFATRVFRYSVGWSNSSGTWKTGTETRETSTTPPSGVSSTSDMGSCRVTPIPDSSLIGRGLAGEDIGASVLYRYQDGVLTTTKLWATSAPSGYTGTSYPFYFPLGAVISGVNSDPATSAVGVANRLNVISSCLPGGY